MNVSRRQFLKLSGATAATLAVVDLGFNPREAKAASNKMKTATADVSPSICPYCSVGCGILVHSKGDRVIYTEGDPDHPINRGSTCSKGASIRQLNTSERRFTKPMYRAPGSSEWQEKDWDWMLDEISKRIKETRDNNFIQTENGMPVNRVDAIANLGGAALENEECYMIQKLARGLGVVYIEHQARI